MSEEQKQLDELTLHVTSHFTTQDTQEIQQRVAQVLELLLQPLQKGVAQATREALLAIRGPIAQKRDEEWSRVICAIWLRDADSIMPLTNPYDVQAWILSRQQSRERELAALKQREGFLTGLREGLIRGTKLGWGGAQSGKNLDEVLEAASKEKP